MFAHIVGKVPSDLWSRSPAALLHVELTHEKAFSLGRLGRKLEGSLQALSEFDATHRKPLAAHELRLRASLVAEAGRMLWQLIVQREACGLNDSRAVMEDYRVPAEVQREIGSIRAAGMAR